MVRLNVTLKPLSYNNKKKYGIEITCYDKQLLERLYNSLGVVKRGEYYKCLVDELIFNDVADAIRVINNEISPFLMAEKISRGNFSYTIKTTIKAVEHLI